jgi:hypothetical protein
LRIEPKGEFACPAGGFDICGRLVVQQERYADLEEELKKTKEDREKYRQLFSILLERVEYRLLLDIIPEIFKQNMSQIPEVKSVYCIQRRNIVSLWVLLDEQNWDVEDQIYESYGELLSAFPNYDIRIRLLRLWGRKPEDLMPARGVKVLG